MTLSPAARNDNSRQTLHYSRLLSCATPKALVDTASQMICYIGPTPHLAQGNNANERLRAGEMLQLLIFQRDRMDEANWRTLVRIAKEVAKKLGEIRADLANAFIKTLVAQAHEQCDREWKVRTYNLGIMFLWRAQSNSVLRMHYSGDRTMQRPSGRCLPYLPTCTLCSSLKRQNSSNFSTKYLRWSPALNLSNSSSLT